MGECVDLTSNDNNCGRCGARCTGRDTGGDNCQEGACRLGCTDGYSDCDPNGDSCVFDDSMATDPINCGDCNDTCRTNQVCTESTCVSFYIGRGCTECPCDDCSSTVVVHNCCIYPGTVDLVMCLDPRYACP